MQQTYMTGLKEIFVKCIKGDDLIAIVMKGLGFGDHMLCNAVRAMPIESGNARSDRTFQNATVAAERPLKNLTKTWLTP